MNRFLSDPRFAGIEPFQSKVWLSSPTMHGDEQKWVDDAIQTNWVSTVGANIDAMEKQMAEYVGVKYAVGLSCGTSALHLATKLAGEALYGQARPNAGTLAGHKVFCSDVTFDASINPVAYEDGEAVFIDSEYDTWNMSPEGLEKAFELYPDVKLVVIAHLYGTPGKMEEIKKICDAHGALIVEDAAESLGAKYKLNGQWVETGSLGNYNAISFNGNKIITGSAGGMFLTDSKEDADKVRKWSTQSREAAPWYQHEEIGYNYRMSNIIAGVIRGQVPYLDEHIAQKRAIWERYEKGLADLPVKMNPWDREKSVPNFWLLHDHRRRRHGAHGARRAGLPVPERQRQEQPPGNPGRHRRFQRRRPPHLETHAHAADLPDKCVRDGGGEWPGPQQRLYRRFRH